MLRLATLEDIPEINRILNHEEIYRWATMGKRTAPLDIGPAFDKVFVLLEDTGGGCIVLDPYSEGTVEVHTCLLEAFRGKNAAAIVRDTLRFAFAETGCMEILTKVPTDNKAADLFARQVGFVRVADGEDLRSYQLTIERWPYLDATLGDLCPPEMVPMAMDDHQRRLFGGLMLMSRRGFMGKAVSIYNKHARLQGYLPVEVCGMDSLMVGGLAIHFGEDGSFRVEDVCQPQLRVPVS
jgi:RimJ/RimL family protein N-acetyltransferase